jgi:AraC-like DNA-binding protein
VVACFWSLPHTARNEPKRILPDGSVDLIVSLGTSPADVVLEGVTSKPKAPVYPDDGERLGVSFVPGAAGAVLGISAQEYSERTVPLQDVLGNAVRDIGPTLRELPTVGARLAWLEQWIRARLDGGGALRRHGPPVRALVGAIERARGTLPLHSLNTGYSERQLERIFLEHLGLGPKLYARIVRFRNILGAANRSRRPSWAALATQHGFSDQAHVIREFMRFAEVTPGSVAMSDFFNP